MSAAGGESWHAALHRLQESGEPHALASIVGAAGSTPREPGAKLVVTRNDVIDTLGGGHFEQQVIDTARGHLAAPTVSSDTYLEAFPLGGRSGQCCGGFVHVLLELFAGADNHLTLFGAGHVGQAMVELLSPLPWRIDWFDSRPEALSDKKDYPPRIRPAWLSPGAGPIAWAVAAIPAGSHVLVMTHDHAQDRELIAALIGRTDLASLGMIGSHSKWASFRSRLLADGHDTDQLDRVRCPIGLGGSASKRPREIAISVAAELLAYRSESHRVETCKAEPRQSKQRGVAPAALRDAFSPSTPIENHDD